MSSAVAILTYRRSFCIKAFLASLLEKAPGYRVAIFEDFANSDDTFEALTAGAVYNGIDAELEADVWEKPTHTVYMGRRNLGVSGNSNRAIRWFMRGAEDHLCLCNDDLIANGDFVKVYAAAHTHHKVGLWCYCPFDDELHRGAQIMHKGKPVRLLPRKTGCMMSMTRALVDRIGYYDIINSRFGNDHCLFNLRATLAGFLNINGQPQHCLDIPCPELAYQSVPSSIYPFEKPRFDQESDEDFTIESARHAHTGHYRPFRLYHGRYAGGYDGAGIPVYDLLRAGYELVVDYDLHDEAARLA
jgi:glycosyltransferase involved in cell wall biosynthesis